MVIIFNEFENNIVNKLKKSGLIDRYSINEFTQSPNSDFIIKSFENSYNIDFDDQGLFIIDDQGEKVYCPEIFTSISDKGEWLSDKIPDVEFDIDQNGNVRKADEAEALFCCINVSNIIRDSDFKNEVLEIAKEYDFDAMKNRSDGNKNFRDLLSEWQDLQSVIINILISACKFKIRDVKKDTEKFLRDGISNMEASELRDVESKIRCVNFKYSEGDLSPDKIKNLTKIEKLTKINERDAEISELIEKSKCGVLYKLLNLSSEYISPIKKKKIFLWVRQEVDKEIENNPSLDQLKMERSQIISRIQKRAIKFEKNSTRRIFIEKYINDKENFKFPAKL